MKAVRHNLKLTLALAGCLAISGSPALRAAEPPPLDVPTTLRRLQEQLNEQNKRLDRLYNAIGPELEMMEQRASAVKKQQEEDAALALKPAFRIEDENFNSKLLFLPGSRRLALAGDDGTIRLLALPEGKVEATLRGAEGRIAALAATADGKKLFAGTDKGLVFFWADEKGPAVKVTDTHGWPVTALAVSPEGKRVAWASHGHDGAKTEWTQPEESLVVLEAATGKKLWAAKVGRADFQAVSFAGDGKTIAFVKNGSVVIHNAETGRVVHELEHEGCPSGPLSTALSRDGNICAIGYAPDSVALWDARSGKCSRLLKAHSNWVVSLAFTPDGTLLASSAGDSTASVWQVATGKEVGRLRFGNPGAYVNSVSISDDGRWLAVGISGEYVVLELPRLAEEAPVIKGR